MITDASHSTRSTSLVNHKPHRSIWQRFLGFDSLARGDAPDLVTGVFSEPEVIIWSGDNIIWYRAGGGEWKFFGRAVRGNTSNLAPTDVIVTVEYVFGEPEIPIRSFCNRIKIDIGRERRKFKDGTVGSDTPDHAD